MSGLERRPVKHQTAKKIAQVGVLGGREGWREGGKED